MCDLGPWDPLDSYSPRSRRSLGKVSVVMRCPFCCRARNSPLGDIASSERMIYKTLQVMSIEGKQAILACESLGVKGACFCCSAPSVFPFYVQQGDLLLGCAAVVPQRGKMPRQTQQGFLGKTFPVWWAAEPGFPSHGPPGAGLSKH